MTDQWLSAEQAGVILNITDPKTIHRAARDGHFGDSAVYIGKQLRINPAFFQSAQAAARDAALIHMADALIAQATEFKQLLEARHGAHRIDRQSGPDPVDLHPNRTLSRLA